MSTIAVAVFSIVVLVATAAFFLDRTFGSTSRRPRSSTSTTVDLHRVGDFATTSGLEVRVLGFEDPQSPTANHHAAPAGQHLVSVNVRVRNPGTDSRDFTPLLQCVLSDAQHDAITPPGFDPVHVDRSDLTGIPLAPGARAEQHVVFTVPNRATGLVFTVLGSLTATGSAFALT